MDTHPQETTNQSSANINSTGATRRASFATMPSEQQRRIAAAGGRAAHQQGVGHEFTSDEAKDAGRKGGISVSQNREHMAKIGRLGSAARRQRLQAAQLSQQQD